MTPDSSQSLSKLQILHCLKEESGPHDPKGLPRPDTCNLQNIQPYSCSYVSGFLPLIRVTLHARQQETGILQKPLKLKSLSSKASAQCNGQGFPHGPHQGPCLGRQKEPAGRSRWRWSPLPPEPQSCIEIHGLIDAGPWGGAITSWPRQGTSWPPPCSCTHQEEGRPRVLQQQ